MFAHEPDELEFIEGVVHDVVRCEFIEHFTVASRRFALMPLSCGSTISEGDTVRILYVPSMADCAEVIAFQRIGEPFSYAGPSFHPVVILAGATLVALGIYIGWAEFTVALIAPAAAVFYIIDREHRRVRAAFYSHLSRATLRSSFRPSGRAPT